MRVLQLVGYSHVLDTMLSPGELIDCVLYFYVRYNDVLLVVIGILSYSKQSEQLALCPLDCGLEGGSVLHNVCSNIRVKSLRGA